MRAPGLMVLGLLLAGAATAQPLAAGDVLDRMVFEDQHGRAHRVDGRLRAILFTRDMDAGKIVREVLAENGKRQLAAARAAYVTDLSGMPGVVRRLFALPKLRKRPYPIWIDTDGKQTARFPSRPGAVAWIALRDREITAIRFLDTPAALRAALKEAADPGHGEEGAER